MPGFYTEIRNDGEPQEIRIDAESKEDELLVRLSLERIIKPKYSGKMSWVKLVFRHRS